MSYAAVADIIAAVDADVLVQLTDDDGTGEINETVIAAEKDKAYSVINGYLAGRYPIPLPAPQPEILKTYEIDMTVCRLYERRQGPPEHIAKRSDAATEFLRMAARGEVEVIPQAQSGCDSGISLAEDNPPRLFSRETMKGF